jgi:hypothetical protein
MMKMMKLDKDSRSKTHGQLVAALQPEPEAEPEPEADAEPEMEAEPEPEPEADGEKGKCNPALTATNLLSKVLWSVFGLVLGKLKGKKRYRPLDDQLYTKMVAYGSAKLKRGGSSEVARWNEGYAFLEDMA